MAVDNDYRNYLMHHGILGQRWGVRRYQNADGSLTSKGKNRYSRKEKKELRIKAEKARDAKIKSMSDQELRDRINRLNMEKTYKSLTNSEATNKGKKRALSVLRVIGEVAAVTGSVATVVGLFKSPKATTPTKVSSITKAVKAASSSTRTILN